MFDIGAPELILILVIILVLFGGKKLPELSKSVADSIKELRRGFTDDSKKSDSTPAEKKDSDKA